MADRWALIIATDKFLDSALGTVPYAESGAKALADALAIAGYPKANQFVLLGAHATRTIIESRLRKLKKLIKRNGEVLAYVAGRGFSHAGAGVLACWDTLPDDLSETSLPLADFLAALSGSKAAQVTLLLDVGAGAHSPIADFLPHLDDEQLQALFADSPKAVGLSATRPDESTHAAAGLKNSAWTHLLVEALTGRAAKALNADGELTALSLQRFIEDELPRALRKHFETGVAQTPQLYGEQNAGQVIANLSQLIGADGSLLDPERLRRVVFRSESLGRVKDLTAWRKTYDLPDSARPSAQKFVARIANPDVKTDLDEVYDAAREQLGYKRKDLEVATGPDGFGLLRTPDFEYTVTASLDADDPTRIIWRREVGGFTDPGFIRGTGFDAIFGKLFDQLVFEFAAPIDVAALVDRLEEHPPKGVKLQVASEGTSCDISLAGFAGRVTIDRAALVVRGRAGDSVGLLDQLLTFLRTVGPLGEQLALPS